MKIKLVNDYKSAWKWITIHLSILGGAATAMWEYMPALQSAVPQPLATKITIGLFASIAIGRLIRQGGSNAGDSSSS